MYLFILYIFVNTIIYLWKHTCIYIFILFINTYKYFQ